MSEFHFSLLPLLYGSLVGLSLGFTGGGGAIVAIPLLIYGLDFQFTEATAISLAVVGATALYGALLQSRKGHVLWLVGGILGCGGIPTIPIGKWVGQEVSQRLLLFVFGLLMTFIGLKMILNGKLNGHSQNMARLSNANTWSQLSLPKIALLLFFGAIVGVLSGTFGIGGGFFLVPTLDLILRIPIEQATATSLVGIFIIAASGVVASADILASVDKNLALQFFLGSASGMTLGAFAKNFVPPRNLEILFGSFVLATAAFVLLHNIF